MKKRIPDPIIAEIHKVRERFWTESRQRPAQLWINIQKRADLALSQAYGQAQPRRKKIG